MVGDQGIQGTRSAGRPPQLCFFAVRGDSKGGLKFAEFCLDFILADGGSECRERIHFQQLEMRAKDSGLLR